MKCFICLQSSWILIPDNKFFSITVAIVNFVHYNSSNNYHALPQRHLSRKRIYSPWDFPVPRRARDVFVMGYRRRHAVYFSSRERSVSCLGIGNVSLSRNDTLGQNKRGLFTLIRPLKRTSRLFQTVLLSWSGIRGESKHRCVKPM